jgi:hypothetical protein
MSISSNKRSYLLNLFEITSVAGKTIELFQTKGLFLTR